MASGSQSPGSGGRGFQELARWVKGPQGPVRESYSPIGSRLQPLSVHRHPLRRVPGPKHPAESWATQCYSSGQKNSGCFPNSKAHLERDCLISSLASTLPSHPPCPAMDLIFHGLIYLVHIGKNVLLDIKRREKRGNNSRHAKNQKAVTGKR